MGLDPAAALAKGKGAAAAADAPSVSFFREDHVTEGGAFVEGWAEKLRAQGFERLAAKGAMAKDERSFLKSLDDTLAFVGKKAAGAYPGPGSSEAEVTEYRKAAGVPDVVEGYELKPRKMPDGLSWNDSSAGEVAAILHKYHVPAAAAPELVAHHLKETQGIIAQARETFQARTAALAEESRKTFAKEWGEESELRRKANREFVKSQGIDVADPLMQAALSHPAIVRFVDSARRALREVPLPGAEQAVFAGGGSARQQALEIMGSKGYASDPEKQRRVQELYAADAKIRRRR